MKKNKADFGHKIVSGVAKVTLLAMIFAIIFAGTLSGAFGIESLAIEQAQLDGIDGNLTDLTDTVGIADAANYASTTVQVPYFDNDPTKTTVDLTSQYDTYYLSRAGYASTNQDHTTKGTWNKNSWSIGDNSHHSFTDYAHVAFDFDFGENWNKLSKSIEITLSINNITNNKNWLGNVKIGGYIFAILSGENEDGTSPFEDSDGKTTVSGYNGDNTFDGIKNDSSISYYGNGDGEKGVKTFDGTNGNKTMTGSLSLSHTIKGRYVRIVLATYSTDGDYGNVSATGVHINVTREMADYQIAYDDNSDYNANYTNNTEPIANTTNHKFMQLSNISTSVYEGKEDYYYFDHWNTAANGSGVNLVPGGSTGTSTDANTFGDYVKTKLIASQTPTLFAQYNEVQGNVQFKFNNVIHTVGDGSPLAVLKNKTGYIESVSFITTINSTDTTYSISVAQYYDTSDREIDEPKSVGRYTAKLNINGTVNGSTTVRGSFKIAFQVVEGDFGVLNGKTIDSTWGSKDNPFVISSEQHLYNLSQIVNDLDDSLPRNSVQGKNAGNSTNTTATDITYAGCYFVVTADLDLSADEWKNIFNPIGDYSLDTTTNKRRVFKGTFYGAKGANASTGVYNTDNPEAYKNRENVTIKISFDDISKWAKYVGLFGYIDGSSTTGGVSIENITIEGTVTGRSLVGGIAAYANNTRFYGCQNNAEIRAEGKEPTNGNDASTPDNAPSEESAGAYAGGIVGFAYNSTIKNCYNNKSVKIAGSYGWYSNDLGGIAGYSNGAVSYCYSEGTIEGSSFIGGIVGRNDGTVSYCYFNGDINGTYNDSSSKVGYITGNGDATFANNTCLILSNTVLKPQQVGNVKYKQQSPKVTTSTENSKKVDFVPAYRNGNNWVGVELTEQEKTAGVDIWTKICNLDIVGINFAPVVNEDKYLQLNGETAITANDSLSTSTSSNKINVDLYFSAQRSTEINVAIADIVFANAEGSDTLIIADNGAISKVYNGTSNCPIVAFQNGVRTAVYAPLTWNFASKSGGTYNSADAPINAGEYTINVKLKVGDKLVGQKTSDYTITQAQLTLTAEYTNPANPTGGFIDTLNSPYTYNALHQGLAKLTVSGIVDGKVASAILSVSTTWGTNAEFHKGSKTEGSETDDYFSFSKAIVVRDGGYSVTVSVKTDAIGSNYKLSDDSASSYAWIINKKALTLTAEYDGTPALTTPYYTYYYTGAYQGVKSITANVAGDDAIDDILTVTPTNCTLTENTKFEFEGAVDAGNYFIRVALSGTTLSNNYELDDKQFRWDIYEAPLILGVKDHNNDTFTTGESYTYTGAHQGLTNLEIGGIVDGKVAREILSVSTTWGTNAEFHEGNKTEGSETNDYFSFSNAIVVGSYTVVVTVSDSNYVLADLTISRTYTWTITQAPLTLTAEYTNPANPTGGFIDTLNSPYTYNALHQGLAKLTVSGIVDGNVANAILSVSTTWGTDAVFSGNTFTFSNAIVVGSYTVDVTVNTDAIGSNYKLSDDSASSYAWTIGKATIKLVGQDHGNNAFPQGSEQTYTYNTYRQGLVQIEIIGLYNVANEVIVYTTSGGFVPADGNEGENPWNSNLAGKNMIYMNTINADEYSITVALKGDDISANYVLYDANDQEVTEIKYIWTINPKPIDVRAFAYNNGIVANNAISTLFGGYPLSRIGDDDIALVYQTDETYIANNFVIYTLITGQANPNYLKLAEKNAEGNYVGGFGCMAFKAQRYDNTSGAWVDVANMDEISLTSDDHTPRTYTLKFVSLDPNYVVTTESRDSSGNVVIADLEGKEVVNPDQIIYTLLISDFGGNFDQADWGSEGNPFVISTEAHLLRLSQIVNGAVAWNSIHLLNTLTDDQKSALCATTNGNVADTITTRTYQNAYFEVRLPEGQYALTVTQAMGFVPIGGHGTNNCESITVNEQTVYGYFSGTFYNKLHTQPTETTPGVVENYTIRVAQQREDDYVGLFGILKNATIKDTNIVVYGKADASGSPTEAMKGRNYVGSVAGYAVDSTIINVTTGPSALKNRSSWINASGNYVGGLAGYMQNCNVTDVYVKLYGYTGIDYVGGVVGKSVGGRFDNLNAAESGESAATMNGNNYVGGIVGYLDHTSIANLGWDEVEKVYSGAFYTGGLYGKKYVGVVAGYWVVTNGNQVNQYNRTDKDNNQHKTRGELSQGNANMDVKGDTFVGGLAGYFDASNCAGGLAITPKLIGVQENAFNSMKVTGAHYVGALFGVFIGSGYKKDSAEYNKTTDTILKVAGNSDGKRSISATVNIQGDIAKEAVDEDKKDIVSNAYVVGGLVGYISNAGIVFTSVYGYTTGGNYNPVIIQALDNSTDKKEVSEINFIGLIAGIMGENATIECTAPDNTNGSPNDLILNTASSTNSSVTGAISLANNKKHDFVGRIAGYVASNAGIKNGDTATMFGNRMIAVTAGGTSGANYVGGMFGAIGKVNIDKDNNKIEDSINIPYSNADNSTTQEEYRLLYNALRGIPTKGGAESTTTLVFGPRTQAVGESAEPYGRIANQGDVSGANYVGGIVGAVLENARLEFINPQYNGKKVVKEPVKDEDGNVVKDKDGNVVTIDRIVDATAGDLTNAYNGYSFKGDHTYILIGNPIDIPEIKSGSFNKQDDTIDYTRSGSYVGGIAGYLGSGAHLIERVVSAVIVEGEDNIGGIAGYMANGTIQNCLAPYYSYLVSNKTWSAPDSSTDMYRGTSNVGGFVGHLESGKIVNSVSTGMKFDGYADGKADVGGIVGSATQNAKVENSWAIFVSAGPASAGGPLYSAVPKNKLGKFVVIADVVKLVPNYVELATMIGLYNFNASENLNTATNASLYEKNSEGVVVSDFRAKYGELSIGATVPTDNNQLVFYDGSGRDVVSGNSFSVFSNTNSKLYMRFEAFGDNAQNSMIISIKPVKFTNIAPYNGTDEDVKKQHAEAGYVKPSNSDKYHAEVTNSGTTASPNYDVAYEGLGGNISYLKANIFFNGALVGTANNDQQVGAYFEDDFKTGSSADTPYVIASQQDWDDFAWNIYTGQKDYAGEYVRLTTDVEVYYATDHTGKDFTTITTPNNYATDPETGNVTDRDARSNAGYNVAGNLSQGKERAASKVQLVTVVDNKEIVSAESPCTASFKGNFDGGGHTIRFGVNEGGEAWHRMSVFPNAESATFSNLTIDNLIRENNVVPLNVDGAYDVAAFVGKPFGNIGFYNCTNKADITAYRNVAGFASYSSSTVDIDLICCVNDGDITSTATITTDDWNRDTGEDIGTQKNYQHGTGGFIANVSASITVESCINRGAIKTYAVKAGGIIGRVTFAGDNTPTDTSDDFTKLEIKNCANTGEIASYGLNPYHATGEKVHKRSGNVMAEIGGIVGEADDKVQASFYACYNTGKITAYGSVMGGIVGILGRIPDTEKPHSAVADHQSTIDQCYNTGAITGGVQEFGGCITMGLSGYNFNGVDIGGIVGCAVRLVVNNCYNTGDITTYGGVGFTAEWQTRNGGILGEAADEVTYCAITITNCYNVGSIIIKESKNSSTEYGADIIGYMQNPSPAVLAINCFGVENNIVNYDDDGAKKYYSGWNYQGDDADAGLTRKGNTLPSIADLTVILDSNGNLRPKNDDVYNTLTESGNSRITYTESYERYTTATIVPPFFAYHYASHTEIDTNGGTPSGVWLYIPGCLPQLKVFAVDTPNGLSMNSVKVVDSVTGDQKVAGELEEYPYIIRDGIDLWGLQRSVATGNNFANKYIAFASGKNSIFGETRTIDMTTLGYDTSVTASAELFGKSHHLFSLGAVNNSAEGTAQDTTYDAWLGGHYYYTTTGTLAKAADISTSTETWEDITALYNFAPIGGVGREGIVFAGNITGLQYAPIIEEKTEEKTENGATETITTRRIIGYEDTTDGNVTIENLRINVPTVGDYSIAGLFGRTQSGTISYITTKGNINAYADGANEIAMAGGIVGLAGGGSTIDHCNTDGLYIRAEHSTDAMASYAGGIVGMLTNEIYAKRVITETINGVETSRTVLERTYIKGSHTTVSNSEVLNGTIIKTHLANAGGIAGYATATRQEKQEDGTYKAIEMTGSFVDIENCKVKKATINDTDTSAGTIKIGGIISSNDRNIALTIKGCAVGVLEEGDESDSVSVAIDGAYALGGVIGSVTGNTRIEDTTVGANTTINRNKSGIDATYGVAIGGFVGYSIDGDKRVLTFGGQLTYAGTISIAKINSSTDQIITYSSGKTLRLHTDKNVGGIIGYMGSGAVFEDGSNVNVQGEIGFLAFNQADFNTDYNTNNNSNSLYFRQNIGGVAGITKDVEFIGTFNVSPIMSLGYSQEVTFKESDEDKDIKKPIVSNIGGFIGLNEGVCAIIADDVVTTKAGEGRVATEGGTQITIGGTIGVARADDVGGFIGNNSHTLNIGPDEANGVRYYGTALTINIGGIIIGHDNVGGFVGNNEKTVDSVATGIDIEKGEITITGVGTPTDSHTVTGNDRVGGFIGNNTDVLKTGGSVVQDATLSITNAGTVHGNDYVGGVIGFLGGESKITGGTFRNTGTVEGNEIVGGSIGFVAPTAKITSKDSGQDIKFINGTEGAGSTGGTGVSSSDALTAEGEAGTPATNNEIKGNKYVGGSIGVLMGTVEGTEENKVVFDNLGNVGGYGTNVVYFVGGSVAILPGTVKYAVFSNRSNNMEVQGANVVGGSIGFIGGQDQTDPNTGGTIVQKATVENSHFEFTGALTVTNSTGGSDAHDNVGIGGSIGVIKSATWTNNTFYSSGIVTATPADGSTGAINVGGSIGLIIEAGITISNMLAYQTTVEGRENVGGVVGATKGANTKIENSFNVRGKVVGIKAGGIIGLAQPDTDASTSYWVKEEQNSNLEMTDITNLNASLGSDSNVTVSFTGSDHKVDTTNVTDLFTPIEYIETKYTMGTPSDPQTVDTTDDLGNPAKQTITTHTINATFKAGKNTTLAVAFTRIYTESYHMDEAGNKTIISVNTEYKANDATIVDEIGSESGTFVLNKWESIFENKGLEYNHTNGYYVYPSGSTTYTTGTANTGWYFVYATPTLDDDTNEIIDGQINAIHSDFSRTITYVGEVRNADGTIVMNEDGTPKMEDKQYTFGGSSKEENDRQAWKYIANAYTTEELSFIARAKVIEHEDDTKERQDVVITNLVKREKDDKGVYIPYSVDNNSVFNQKHVYATATVGKNITTDSGYYLYMATSGTVGEGSNAKPVRPNVSVENKNGSGTPTSYFIDFATTLAGASSVQNIAIYYRKLQYRSPLTYNGYERTAPISDNNATFTDAGYNFNSFLTAGGSHVAVDTYTSAGTVGFDHDNNSDTDLLPMSEEISFEWQIIKKKLTVTTSSAIGGTYGDSNEITVTVAGISYADCQSVSDRPFSFKVTLDDGTTVIVKREGLGFTATSSSGNVTVGNVALRNDKRFSGVVETGFMAYSQSTETTTWRKLTIPLKFINVHKYALTYNAYDNKEQTSLTNYDLSETQATVKVDPRKLEIKINKTGRLYDQTSNGTDINWEFGGWSSNSGWVLGDGITKEYGGKTYAKLFGGGTNPPSVYFDYSQVKVVTAISTLNALSPTSNAFMEVGDYALMLEGGTKNGDKLIFGNYYFAIGEAKGVVEKNGKYFSNDKYSIGRVLVKIASTNSGGSRVYDKQIGTASYTFEVYDENDKNNPLEITAAYLGLIVDSYTITSNNFEAPNVTGKFANDNLKLSSDKKSATLEFKTGVNAGVYTAILQKGENGGNYIIETTNSTSTTETITYTINALELSVAFINSSDSLVYNTQYQGLNTVRLKNVLSGDDVKFTFSVSRSGGGTVGSIPSSGVGSGDDLLDTIKTSDVGTYKATSFSSLNPNYTFNSGLTYSWTITKAKLTLNVVGGTSVYDGQPKTPTVTIGESTSNTFGNDTLSFKWVITDKPEGKGNVFDEIKDVGTYYVSYDKDKFDVTRSGDREGDNGQPLVNNYEITVDAGECNYTITPAQLELIWYNDTENPLYYNGSEQGQRVKNVKYAGGTPTVSYNGNTGSVTAYADDVLTITLTGQQTDATPEGTKYTMTATVGGGREGNYNITGTTTEYTINKAVATWTASATDKSKVYDATSAFTNSVNIHWNFVHGSYTWNDGDYTFTSNYEGTDDNPAKNVGENKTVKVTLTLKEGIAKNITINNPTATIDGCSITAKDLTVTLDKLRNGKATRAYDEDGSTTYGGAGFTCDGSEIGHSRTYRSGEGFSVSGLLRGIVDDLTIVANYVETGNNRSAFDAYINNVEKIVENGTTTYVIGSGHYKKLVFTMRGADAGNYTFKVKVGSTEIEANGNTATIFDKDDEANNGDQNSGINIEITVKALLASYKHTKQSYANADNTYNTVWKPITGTDETNKENKLDIIVVNGWMYDNGVGGEPKQYEKHTIIRGREGNSLLSASIKPETDGTHINYQLSNQPVLTIGYFVDSEAFPIGSMASLMIAVYYQQSGDKKFDLPILDKTEWKLVATEAQYISGDGVPKDYGTWDEYFAYLETKEGGNKYIFFNTAEGDKSGWGYYNVVYGEGANTYTKFQQVANIDGILTAKDITILDNFFKVYNENGTVNETYSWGYGSENNYIKNFLKVGEGNVSVVLGSIFTDDFTGTFDGNGYTINHVNIMGLTGDKNVGMFANITTKDGKTGSVKNVHLRNFSIIANCATDGTTYNVGGIAGQSSAPLANCTFHGSITVNGTSNTVNVGGIVGSASANITGAIVLGNIDVTNAGKVGGVVGSATGTVALDGVVSMIEILANGSVGAIVGNGSVTATNVSYLANSAYKATATDGGTTFEKAVDGTNGSIGMPVSYDNLMGGSASGYLATAGTYDVVVNVEIIEEGENAYPAARESMHLQDIVKVYLLMYSQANEDHKGYLTVSDSSWLVGEADGTSTKPIVIANQQDVALLRQFRFATFTLANDVEMYSTRPNTVFDGVFYGTVNANGHKIYVHKQNGDGTSPAMFELVVGTALPIEFK